VRRTTTATMEKSRSSDPAAVEQLLLLYPRLRRL
jgi:hypothetical protein